PPPGPTRGLSTSRGTQSAAYRLLPTLLWGLPLVAALVLPWYWWANQATGGQFFHEFLFKHNLERGLGGDEQLDGHEHGWWFYLARLWVDLSPWSLLLPAAAFYLL